MDNERLFGHRFGFEACRAVRAQVIAIKQKHDFTDHQIRWLRHSGQLSVQQSAAQLRPADGTMAVLGWLQIGMFNLFFAGMFFLITFSATPTWGQAMALAAVVTAWFGSTWVLNNLYIAPVRLARWAGVS